MIRRFLKSNFTTMANISSDNKYVEYRPGSMNLLISIPHGGNTKPSDIPDRDAGSYKDGQIIYTHEYQDLKHPSLAVRFISDLRTISLGIDLAREIHIRKGCTPHVVISHLNRSKLDVNRDLDEGTFGVTAAIKAWNAYHQIIEQVKKSMKGRGLILDIHGQNHPEEWIELGYTVPAEMLNSGQYQDCDTSVYSAYRHSKQKMESIMDMINGDYSFGTLLHQTNNEYKVVPSSSFLSPGDGNYYVGGYITQRHGSSQGGMVDSIQVECPSFARTSPTKASFAKNLAIATCKFLDLHYV